MSTARGAIFAMALAGAVPAAAEVSRTPPRPTKFATDLTGRLDAARVAALNERLAAFERETSTQVLVYVDRRLPPGATIEDFANRAFRAWGIGQKDKDNGVLLLAFLDERSVRLEVGYGLEGALPDLRAKDITRDVVKAHFDRGDFMGGVEGGATAILSAVRTEPLRGTGATVAEEGDGRVSDVLVLGLIGGGLVAASLSRERWRGTRAGPTVARAAHGAGAVLWAALAVEAPLALWLRSRPAYAVLLSTFMLVQVTRAVAAAAERRGSDRMGGILSALGYMAAAALLPSVIHGITAEHVVPGSADVHYVLAVSLMVGLLAKPRTRRRRAGAGGAAGSDWSPSWSSSDSSSTSWSDSSSDSSSSSDFSGGGGDSGGGGSSDGGGGDSGGGGGD